MTVKRDAALGGLVGALVAAFGVAFVDELLHLEGKVRRLAAELRAWLIAQGVLEA